MHEIIGTRLGPCVACLVGVGLVVLGAVAHSLTDVILIPFISACAGVIVFAAGVLAYRRALREMRRKRGF